MNKLLDLELLGFIQEVSEIDYEQPNFPTFQRAGALAFTDLVAMNLHDGAPRDKALTALVLVRLRDLQVRDYAMGFTTEANFKSLFKFWSGLLEIAPTGYIAPVACLLSVINYEQEATKEALQSLDLALADDSKYPLALLLRRVYAANWPAASFAAMRTELHPKVCAALFSE